ncbi:MAG: DUF58 domain-containing protein [Pirellulales bacterium]|nr:DUF58 domain-containing protein [Pirellulales bacterium]
MPLAAAAKLSPDAVARLAGLELRARHVVDGYLAGRRRSRRRGQSVEFAEHREYAPGDDPRYVDWKAFGKSDRMYLKQYEAETNLVCSLAVDVSESMRYKSPAAPLSKLEYGACLASALALLVYRQRDSAGLFTFDDRVREVVPPSANPNDLAQIAWTLERAPAERCSAIQPALDELADRLRRRSIVVVVSDLLGDPTATLAGLRHVRHRRHEVVVLQVLDPDEVEFPFDRATRFRGLEALPQVEVEPAGVRRAYLAALARFLEALESGCRESQIDYELCRTDEPFDAPLRRVLMRRAVRGG